MASLSQIIKQLVLILFILPLSGCDLQNDMLYYPSSNVPGQNELAARHIQFWPHGPDGYRGFVSTVRISDAKGTIIVFHGNAGTAADRDYYVNDLPALGYRVILAEYPGYGARKGKLGEASFVNDAKETVRIAVEQYGKPIYLLGESLGCAVAASLVKETSDQINGVILITPWNTLLAVAKEKFPWLPVSLFLTDKYDSNQNLKAFQGRIAVVGAERDDIIPIHHAQALYESLSGQKKMWTIRGAGHNDWLDLVDRSKWKEITDFAKGE
jgi:pimeloyl-ACP methyl ester carboxylesterase